MILPLDDLVIRVFLTFTNNYQFLKYNNNDHVVAANHYQLAVLWIYHINGDFVKEMSFDDSILLQNPHFYCKYSKNDLVSGINTMDRINMTTGSSYLNAFQPAGISTVIISS